jgi:hypothetical protein
MVNYNSCKYIFDEGIKKTCEFNIMWVSKSEAQWDREIYNCLRKFSPIVQKSYIDENFNKQTEWIKNPDYQWRPASKRLKIELFIVAKYRWNDNVWYFDDGDHDSDKKICFMLPCQSRAITRWSDVFSLRELQEYAGTLPFEPWIMINISPDWKGVEIDEQMIRDFKQIILNYMKEGWFEKWEYALEGGSEGNFLHAHIVAKLGSHVKDLAQVKGHCWGKKNNHEQQLMKYARKTKCMSSVLKRPGIHKCIINHPDMLKDKRDYLIERKKPHGHKNKKMGLKGLNQRYIGKLKSLNNPNEVS